MNDVKERHAELLEKWYEARDKQELRVKYPLKPDSIVFDVGAYHGVWAKEMYKRYGCYVHCFEPIPSFYRKLVNDTSHSNKRIKCHRFAIGGSNRNHMMMLDKDASGFFAKTGRRKVVQVTAVGTVLEKFMIDYVDMIKINIEGAEYEVLEHMIEDDLLKKFGHIQIQFHREVPNFEERRDKIRQALAKTHNEDYNYEFIWESWTNKDLA